MSLDKKVKRFTIMEKTQGKNATIISPTSFGAGKPVVPFSGSQQVSTGRSSDPSSCLRADRYPIPGAFEYRSSYRERV